MFYSDKPIQSSNDDCLNRSGFAQLLARTLVSLKSQDTYTVGLFGKWGCGKTSLVNMALSEIEEIRKNSFDSRKMTIIHFDPWNFFDTNQLFSQFFVRMANELKSKKDKSLNQIGRALEKYSGAFDLLSLIPGTGKPLASVFKWIGKTLQTDIDSRDALKQKKIIVDLLQKQNNRILVILDDIDRLSNEQIRCIFQLITSVAKFPNITYLLVFDREIVVNALNSVQCGNGQEYLDKIIQMPIQIPDIRRTDLSRILFTRLDKIINDFQNLHFSKDYWERIFTTCVKPMIKNLRDVNRLCNTLRFKLADISSEINFVDLIALSVLEIRHPSVYIWIQDNKAILTGGDNHTVFLPHNDSKKFLTIYTDKIRTCLLKERPECDGPDSDAVELIKNTLVILFPYFAKKIGLLYDSYISEQLLRENRVAHPNKFNRYFELSLGNISYTTADIDNVLFQFSEEEILNFLEVQDKNSFSYEALEDIHARLDDIPSQRAKILVTAISKSVKYLTNSVHKNLFTINSGSYAEKIIPDILEKIDGKDRVSFISDMIQNATVDTLPPISYTINTLELAYGRLGENGNEHNYKKIISLESLQKLEPKLENRTKELLLSHSLFDFYKWNLIYVLINSFDREYAAKLLEKEFETPKNILHFLGKFIGTWIGGESEFEVNEHFKEYLTVQQILNALYVCIQNGSFEHLPSQLKEKCAAFYLYASPSCNHRRNIMKHDVDKIISIWNS